MNFAVDPISQYIYEECSQQYTSATPHSLLWYIFGPNINFIVSTYRIFVVVIGSSNFFPYLVTVQQVLHIVEC